MVRPPGVIIGCMVPWWCGTGTGGAVWCIGCIGCWDHSEAPGGPGAIDMGPWVTGNCDGTGAPPSDVSTFDLLFLPIFVFLRVE